MLPCWGAGTGTRLLSAPDAIVVTGARSVMRFPQFVQKMIPAGLSHPQLPQRIC